MVYVPSEWIKHHKNKKKVTKVLEKLDCDFTVVGEESFNEEDAIKELEEMDEPIVIENLRNGKFNFGA